jgi:acyl carrier protein
MVDEAVLRGEIKQLIVSTLHLEGIEAASIGDDQQLFGGGLGLDSVDALELMVAIEKQYGIHIEADDVDRAAFRSATTLARMVAAQLEHARPASP